MGSRAKILSELYANNLTSSEQDIIDAVFPLLKLLSLTLFGLVLAHKSTQVIPKATFKLLSKLVFALFLPCLIFTQLGESITVENFTRWWFIPVNVIISTTVGCFLGIFVVIICRPPPEFTRFTIIMTSFGNTGNLPLAIVGTVCHNEGNPFGHDCRNKGVSYVSFAQWVAMILVYTFVYHMMEPPVQYYEVVEEGDTSEDQSQGGDVSRPLLVEAEWPGIEDKETEDSKTPVIANVFGSISSMSQMTLPDIENGTEGSTNSPRSVSCLAAPRVVKKMKVVAERTPIQHVLQPPTIASLLAIVIGMVPQAKAFFFGRDAPLFFITDSLEILARAMVPSVMLILGGMLAEVPNKSKLGLRTMVGITVARLLVLPLFGIGTVALADKLHLLVDGDKMFKFVVLLQYTTPSAILLGAIASLRGYAVSESSALLFWQHLFALFSLSFYVIVYFKLL